MADWKTYAKAARNTARKQGPDLAGYVRAAGKAIEAGVGEEPRTAGTDRPHPSPDDRPLGERLQKDAAAYYTVAERHMKRANIVPRILRAIRDAALIGVSLLAIWAVLAAAGIPIPFTGVLIAVLVIMVLSAGVSLFSERRRDAAEASDRG